LTPWNRILRQGALLGALLLPVPAAIAQAPGQAPSGDGDSLPLSVDADQSIEWHQDQKAYVARGNALATRGDMSVSSDVLIAYYREIPSGGTEIWRLAAEGNVLLSTPTQKVEGDRAVYDVDRQVAVVTGDGLKLTTPTDVVTARDSLEYWEDRRLAVARGDAVAVRNQNRVNADLLVGQFEEDASGSLRMRRIDAQGDVVITTPTDVARGERGVYDLATEVATLTGGVRLTRGKNQLNGDAAEVNMKTGVSRLVNTGGGPARVRGLFVPGEQAGAPGTAPPAPAGDPGAGAGNGNGERAR
jgi:lipopolysaccharide export system protein LptA